MLYAKPLTNVNQGMNEFIVQYKYLYCMLFKIIGKTNTIWIEICTIELRLRKTMYTEVCYLFYSDNVRLPNTEISEVLWTALRIRLGFQSER